MYNAAAAVKLNKLKVNNRVLVKEVNYSEEPPITKSIQYFSLKKSFPIF